MLMVPVVLTRVLRRLHPQTVRNREILAPIAVGAIQTAVALLMLTGLLLVIILALMDIATNPLGIAPLQQSA